MLGTKKGGSARVPMDDDHTMTFLMHASARRRPGHRADQRGLPPMLPNTNDWYGRFRLEQNLANDFQIDRDLQRANKGRPATPASSGIAMQDAAMTGEHGADLRPHRSTWAAPTRW